MWTTKHNVVLRAQLRVKDVMQSWPNDHLKFGLHTTFANKHNKLALIKWAWPKYLFWTLICTFNKLIFQKHKAHCGTDYQWGSEKHEVICRRWEGFLKRVWWRWKIYKSSVSIYQVFNISKNQHMMRLISVSHVNPQEMIR